MAKRISVYSTYADRTGKHGFVWRAGENRLTPAEYNQVRLAVAADDNLSLDALDSEPATPALSGMTKAELVAYAAENLELDLSESSTKAELVAAVKAALE